MRHLAILALVSFIAGCGVAEHEPTMSVALGLDGEEGLDLTASPTFVQIAVRLDVGEATELTEFLVYDPSGISSSDAETTVTVGDGGVVLSSETSVGRALDVRALAFLNRFGQAEFYEGSNTLGFDIGDAGIDIPVDLFELETGALTGTVIGAGPDTREVRAFDLETSVEVARTAIDASGGYFLERLPVGRSVFINVDDGSVCGDDLVTLSAGAGETPRDLDVTCR